MVYFFDKEAPLEQIYMIPVSEAFEACAGKVECGCPICSLYKKLQTDELDIILGASMMEPDIRIKTNEMGFCPTHYNMMLGRRRMLGMGLMMESHLSEVRKMLDGPVVLGDKRAAALGALGKLEGDCYVCGRINRNLSAMISTTVYLWQCDYNGFRKRFSEQTWFCMPHYRAMLEYASKKLPKKTYREFYDSAYAVQDKYLKTLSEDVSWFCKKFDYRYDEEPWYNSKDSVKRAIRFLGGCFGEDESVK